MADLSRDARTSLVTRLDPDGRIRDLIDVALARYDQRRRADDGTSRPTQKESRRNGCDDRPE